MNSRESASLDRYITGNYGEDQVREDCSAVTRTDWPTRVNDIICSQRALYICQQEGCEAPLCIVHVEVCPKCKQEFCEGCMAVHICG